MVSVSRNQLVILTSIYMSNGKRLVDTERTQHFCLYLVLWEGVNENKLPARYICTLKSSLNVNFDMRSYVMYYIELSYANLSSNLCSTSHFRSLATCSSMRAFYLDCQYIPCCSLPFTDMCRTTCKCKNDKGFPGLSWMILFGYSPT